MSHNGVRKRVKVRWMFERPNAGDQRGDAHAFLILTGGTLRDYAMCGLKLGAMHRWFAAIDAGGAQCRSCKQAMGKGSRA